MAGDMVKETKSVHTMNFFKFSFNFKDERHSTYIYIYTFFMWKYIIECIKKKKSKNKERV
jgi:hypothetical protein